MTWKRVARSVLPPLVVDAVRALRRSPPPDPPQWEYLPSGWAHRDPNITGWNVESILRAQQARWPAFVEAARTTGPLGLAHEAASPSTLDHGAHNTVMSFAYVLARAARHRDRLSILDWGGGLGHYCVFSQALLPDVAIDYHVKDVPLLCQGGREVLPQVTFHDNEACLEREYDLVMASGSFQYAEDWRALAGRLAAATRGFLYITRLPVVRTVDSFVVVQRPAVHGYLTEYLGWFLNRDHLVAEVSQHGMTLDREFLIQERPKVHQAPEQGEYRGFLFRPAARGGPSA